MKLKKQKECKIKMANTNKLTPKERQSLQDDCIQALRNLTESGRNPSREFDGQNYFQSSIVTGEIIDLRKARGVHQPLFYQVKRMVPRILESYVEQGKATVERDKQKYYRAV